MRTIHTDVYTFDELNDQAKQKAMEWYRLMTSYSWSQEAIDSLNKMTERFGGKIKDYSIDFYDNSYSSIDFDMPEMEEAEIKEILDTLGNFNPDTLKGLGDCVLTGVCFDEAVIDGFRQAWYKGERNLDKLMQAGFKTWLEDCQSDALSQLEDEQVAESIRANEYDFTIEGKRFIA